MTILHGNNRNKIQFSISNTIHECDRHTYIVELPTLICSNKKDAETMQQEIGIFVSELSKAVLNNSKK